MKFTTDSGKIRFANLQDGELFVFSGSLYVKLQMGKGAELLKGDGTTTFYEQDFRLFQPGEMVSKIKEMHLVLEG